MNKLIALAICSLLAYAAHVSAQNKVLQSHTIYKQASNCDADDGSYNAEWNSDATNDPTTACVTGSNVLTTELQFSDAAALYIYTEMFLPSDWTGAIDVLVLWKTTATSNNVVWQVQTACSAVGETIDPSWNTASTVTDAAQGTASRLNTASLTSITTTGCAAGEMLYLRLLRDPGHASDNLGATANLLGAQITYRRAV